MTEFVTCSRSASGLSRIMHDSADRGFARFDDLRWRHPLHGTD